MELNARSLCMDELGNLDIFVHENKWALHTIGVVGVLTTYKIFTNM